MVKVFKSWVQRIGFRLGTDSIAYSLNRKSTGCWIQGLVMSRKRSRVWCLVLHTNCSWAIPSQSQNPLKPKSWTLALHLKTSNQSSVKVAACWSLRKSWATLDARAAVEREPQHDRLNFFQLQNSRLPETCKPTCARGVEVRICGGCQCRRKSSLPDPEIKSELFSNIIWARMWWQRAIVCNGHLRRRPWKTALDRQSGNKCMNKSVS